MLEIAAEVAETDGVLLEIACGPGAGLTPRALLTDPDRRVILNDICTGVLQLHREYLAETGLGANVICMAFDASERVMRPATVDVVSGFLALSFMGGQDANDRGLNAAYEALVPGGKLFIVDKSYDPEEIKLLPVDVRKRLAMDRRTSWPDRLAEVGFEIDECERFPSQAESDPDESVFAKEALAVGVTLQSYAEFVIATKA